MSTPSNFDPTKLSGTSSQPAKNNGPRSERVILVVENYELPSDGPHYAVGHRFNNPNEKVRVRLTTVNERVADSPKNTEEKVRAQYVSGDNTRETIEAKSKGNIGLIAFDDSKLVSNENGVATYRAHWPMTISTSADAELMHGQGHIRLREANYRGSESASQAYIELLKGGTVVNKDNIDQALRDGLTIKDDQARARDPFVVVRISHDDKLVAQTRIYPGTEPFSRFDNNTGETKISSRPVDFDQTLTQLMSGAAGKSDVANRSQDTARAIIAGLKGLPEPTLVSADEGVRDSIRNLYFGAQAGALQIEMISAEKIDFGPDTRKTYLKNHDRPQFAPFTVKEAVPNGPEGQMKESAGFTPIAIGILRHPDGEPFAVYASAVDMYPRAKKQGDLTLEAINNAAATVELDKSMDNVPVIQEPLLPNVDDEHNHNADSEPSYDMP